MIQFDPGQEILDHVLNNILRLILAVIKRQSISEVPNSVQNRLDQRRRNSILLAVVRRPPEEESPNDTSMERGPCQQGKNGPGDKMCPNTLNPR